MLHEKIQILIVDDSRIFRGLLQDAFAQIPDVNIVGSVFNGEKAIEFLTKLPVDLVTLDLEMPGLGGLATLKAIREMNRSRPRNESVDVLLVSSLTKQGAKCTVEGLLLGAIDFILKPSGGTEAENRATLRDLLVDKLQIYKQKRMGVRVAMARKTSNGELLDAGAFKPTANPLSAQIAGNYKAIAIGISTGGPETLAHLLPQLAGQTSVPIFIVQHILSGHSNYLAECLSRRLNYPILEAKEDMPVSPGGIYLAQSGSHMVLRRTDGKTVIGLSDAPPENHSRPAVDVFLRSASSVYGSHLIAAIMTGMLNDGAQGVRVVKRGGGFVIAQDEATSVVWGMPRAAIETGSVDLVLPLEQFASTLLRLVAGSPPV